MTARQANREAPRDWIAFAIVSILACGAMLLAGFEGQLLRDNAIYVYSGQQLCEGVPPYVSFFDHKGPLASMVAGIAVFTGRLLGQDDILSVRILYWLLAGLSCGALYLAARRMFQHRWAAIVAAVAMATYVPIGLAGVHGPRAKLVMLLCEILCLYFGARRNTFAAGLLGSLAFLAWQPAAIIPLLVFGLIFVNVEASRRKKAVLLFLAGVFVPWAITLIYYAANGALGTLWDGLISFNFSYLSRAPVTFIGRFDRIHRALLHGYGPGYVQIVVGWVVMLALLGRVHPAGDESPRARLRKYLQSPYCVSMLSLPLLLAISIYDFQYKYDALVLLPHAALGVAFLFSLIFSAIKPSGKFTTLLGVTLTLAFLTIATLAYKGEKTKVLTRQRKAAAKTAAVLSNADTIATVNVPEINALLGRPNAIRYGLITNGIESYIDAEEEGGFEGWLDRIEKSGAPDFLIVADQIEPPMKTWIHENYRVRRDGWASRWRVFEHRAHRKR